MFKFILVSFVLLMVSCGSTNSVVKRHEVCKRDTRVICSKENAPILEKMDSKDLSAKIEAFGASYKDKNTVKYEKTEFSKLDQCISVYQYYNCKAYCQSDTITKEDKIKKDQEIVKQCSGIIDGNKKEVKKDLSLLTTGNRVLIDFGANNVDVDKALKKIIYLAFEQKATKTVGKYVIIDDEVKQKAYDRILKENKWEQNDPRFLPELQKQLAANVMVQINITPLGSKYLLTNKFILISKAIILKTKNLKYTPVPVYDFGKDVDEKLQAEGIYDSFLELAEEFLTSMDK